MKGLTRTWGLTGYSYPNAQGPVFWFTDPFGKNAPN